MVGDEFDFSDVHRSEDSCRYFELAMICVEAEFLVGFDGIECLVLKLVCLELRDVSDPSTFFLFIEQNSCSSIGDHAQSEFELLATVTAQRVEDIPGETFGVNADQRRRGL